jgi:hypothetical protein
MELELSRQHSSCCAPPCASHSSSACALLRRSLRGVCVADLMHARVPRAGCVNHAESVPGSIASAALCQAWGYKQWW